MRAGSLPAWESALLTAAVASSPTSSLVQHLLDQQAARAAARLASTLGLGAATLECKRPLSSQFSVPATAVRLVADEASAIEFAEFVRRTVGLQSTVAIDVEWRPDAPSSPKHRPSLVQLAAAAPPATASEPWVWLIDLEQRDVVATSHALEGLRALLASDRTRILGFSLQTDVDRLQMLFDSGAPAAAASATTASAAATTATTATTATEVAPSKTPAPLLVRRAVDLREACNTSAAAAAMPSKSASLASGSLASQVLKWTGWSLDKTSQCSDWQRRPLTTMQLTYAAADAACLLVLDTALAAAEVERPECCLSAVLSTLSTGPTPAPAAAAAPAAAVEAKAVGEAAVASAFEGKEEEEYAQAALALRQTAAIEGNALRLEARTLPNLEALKLPKLVARTEGVALCVEGLARTRAVVSSVRRALGVDVAEVTQWDKVTLWDTSVKAAVEINALCFTAGPAGSLLVLYPAGERVDCRWLALVLGVPRKRVRLATTEECRELFGAVPGLVPPLPLRAGVRVLCHPQLLSGESGGGSGGGGGGGGAKRAGGRPLWGSACEPSHRLWIGGRARDTLPALARAATRALEGARDGALEGARDGALEGARDGALECARDGALKGARDGARAEAAGGLAAEAAAEAAGTAAEAEPLLVLDGTYDLRTTPLPPFAVLPDPALWHPSLDDALDAFLSRAAEGEGEGEGEGAAGEGEGAAGVGGGGGARPPFCSASARAEAAESEGSKGKGEDDTSSKGKGEDDTSSSLSSSDGGVVRGGRALASLPEHVHLLVDSSLSVLARKLRMIGVDTAVAGEVLRSQQPGMMLSPPCMQVPTTALPPSSPDMMLSPPAGGSEALPSSSPGMTLSPPAGGGGALDPGDIRGARRLVGLLRVGIDPKAVEGHMRCAAIDGRLLVTVAKRAATSFPGAVYRLLATEPGAQFAELLAVLGLQEAVDAGGSRCGICNGDEWLTLRPDQVEAGQVPLSASECL